MAKDMSETILFIPLSKVDAERREVWGWGAEETPDKAGEVMDYESSKPLFQAWSDTIQKNSGGLSMGNVRAMHGAVAAGKLIHFEPRDDVKKFWVGAHIVDEAEWAKVAAGVYTGFSVGGSYARKWTDPSNNRLKRYTAAPAELSLVDNPCMYGATFEMVKAAGMDPEPVQFVGEDGNAALAEMAASMAALVDFVTNGGTDLAKAGARHSSKDTAAIQAIHDNACTLGAGCADVAKVDAGGDLTKGDDVAPWLLADVAAMEISDVSGIVAALAHMAARYIGADPVGAGKLAAAAQLLGDTFNDMTARLATATAAQAASDAQAEVIEAAAAAAVMAMMAKFEGADSPLTKVLNAPDPATDTALAKLATVPAALEAMAAQLGALQTTTADLQKRAAASGPVIRGIPTQTETAGETEASVLQKMIAAEPDPNTRQALQMRLGRVQIAQVHAGGGTRIN